MVYKLWKYFGIWVLLSQIFISMTWANTNSKIPTIKDGRLVLLSRPVIGHFSLILHFDKMILRLIIGHNQNYMRMSSGSTDNNYLS